MGFDFGRSMSGQFRESQNQKRKEKAMMDEKINNNGVSVDNSFEKDNVNHSYGENAFVDYNVGVYFRRQQAAYKDAGYDYTASIRYKEEAGSKLITDLQSVTTEAVQSVSTRPECFIEGHVRTENGLVRDVYDGAHPEEVRHEENGRKVAYSVYNIENAPIYGESLTKYGPQVISKREVSLRNVPLAGADKGVTPPFDENEYH